MTCRVNLSLDAKATAILDELRGDRTRQDALRDWIALLWEMDKRQGEALRSRANGDRDWRIQHKRALSHAALHTR